MEKFKGLIQKYLPDVESFLTTVLLEETDVSIGTSETIDKEALEERVKKSDIYLFTRDSELKSEFIIVLDEVWLGLLSSIMLGVEEKTNNEITRDLLKKFYGDMSESLFPVLKNGGIDPSLEEVQILTKTQLVKEFSHSEYFHLNLEVDGLADHKVRVEILAGNPEAIIQQEEKAGTNLEMNEDNAMENLAESKPGAEKKEQTESDFKKGILDGSEDDSGKTNAREQVISARNVEFEEFLEKPENGVNGDSRSMDMLKDVNMDVSVELGRIELPLGKVLQLTKGSVIELEKLAGEPVDILVNGRNIAKGEVVVIDEHFGVRISSLVTTRQHLVGLS